MRAKHKRREHISQEVERLRFSLTTSLPVIDRKQMGKAGGGLSRFVGISPVWHISLRRRRACIGRLAVSIDEALYVAWVATSKTHRRLGLAELVVRASLGDARKATGLERTVLHATEDGFAVYLTMGYRSQSFRSMETHDRRKWHSWC